MQLSITGYSTALFSTWYFIEELGLLFDAGDGLTSSLMQKARKIDHVFISHADRDHLTGLLQFNQLNAREGYPRIHFPYDSGSFPALAAFSQHFDPHVKGTSWHALKDGEQVQVRENLLVQSIRNNHVPAAADVFKSFGYRVIETKQKLKPEFIGLSQEEIRQTIATIGKENLTETFYTNLLTYSGDTPVDDYEKWNNTKILIHEATFLEKSEGDNENTKRNKHSFLPEVLEMVSQLNIETLILGHFSSRYSNEQINEKIQSLCKEFKIKIPVYRLLPGQVHRDILNEVPIYG
ncbi:MAG: RNAse Z [Filimonas sp.]|nr:RNAse Z [Filimonas sp.]